jgi:uncharacterized membrane protein YfcA
MINFVLGFLIAATIGLTGIGGGSFTVPALVLIAGLSAEEAVGTAFVFSGVLRLIAIPFYLSRKQINFRYLNLILRGALPGLFIGTYVLHLLNHSVWNSIVVVVIGIFLVGSSAISFAPRLQNPNFTRKNLGLLPLLALPIGIESGFSSAGAGALGTLLLLNYSEMAPAEVVGTDILFGLVLAIFGSAFHWRFGGVSGRVLTQFLYGGIPGVLAGCAASRKVSVRKVRLAVVSFAILAGLLLVSSGIRMLLARVE